MKDQLTESIIQHLRAEGVKAPMNYDTKFEEVDVDSLGLYSLIAGVEDEYDVCIYCGESATLESVAQLVDMVIGKLQSSQKVAIAA